MPTAKDRNTLRTAAASSDFQSDTIRGRRFSSSASGADWIMTTRCGGFERRLETRCWRQVVRLAVHSKSLLEPSQFDGSS